MTAAARMLAALLAATSLVACSDARDPVAPSAAMEYLTIAPRFPTPTLPDADDPVEITAGHHHTCVRQYDGDVYCWGLNDEGQVGMLSTTTCASGHGCVDRPERVRAGQFTTATMIEAGANHTCALAPGGGAWCWGGSNAGQLGIGVYGYVAGPSPVSGGLTFTTIGAGTYSTCGTATSGVYCWGKIVNATFGAPSPVQVSPYTGYAAVTVGYLHGCAIFNAGSLRGVDCWGNNRFGQAGSDPDAWPNVPFTGGTLLGRAVNRVTTQNDFTCADQADMTVECFGYGYWGTLGNGSFGLSAMTHVPQPVGNGQALHRVSTGVHHACALDPAGAAWCWGNGNNGELGNGASGVSSLPVAVSGGLTFRAIAAGRHHTCAIGTNDRIYCWGLNYHGQLGTQYPGGWVSAPVQALDP